MNPIPCRKTPFTFSGQTTIQSVDTLYQRSSKVTDEQSTRPLSDASSEASEKASDISSRLTDQSTALTAPATQPIREFSAQSSEVTAKTANHSSEVTEKSGRSSKTSSLNVSGTLDASLEKNHPADLERCLRSKQ